MLEWSFACSRVLVYLGGVSSELVMYLCAHFMDCSCLSIVW